MKGVFGATPWVPKAEIQRMGQTRGPVQFVCKKSPLSSSPCQFSPCGAGYGDPNVSVNLTVVSLTCRLTGYHGVGHGCGPGVAIYPVGPLLHSKAPWLGHQETESKYHSLLT